MDRDADAVILNLSIERTRLMRVVPICLSGLLSLLILTFSAQLSCMVTDSLFSFLLIYCTAPMQSKSPTPFLVSYLVNAQLQCIETDSLFSFLLVLI